nr:hypothetical protein [Paenibacillus sp. FSL R5-0345]
MSKSGVNISSIEEWKLNAPPAKKELHWKKGRSAYELARSWLEGGQPKTPIALTELLHSHADLQGFEAEWAVPEYETKLDQLRGKGRNHDLIIIGTVNSKRKLLLWKQKRMNPLAISWEYMNPEALRSPDQKLLSESDS